MNRNREATVRETDKVRLHLQDKYGVKLIPVSWAPNVIALANCGHDDWTMDDAPTLPDGWWVESINAESVAVFVIEPVR